MRIINAAAKAAITVTTLLHARDEAAVTSLIETCLNLARYWSYRGVNQDCQGSALPVETSCRSILGAKKIPHITLPRAQGRLAGHARPQPQPLTFIDVTP